MTVYRIVLLAAALFAVLQFVVLPKLTFGMRIDRGVAVIGKVGVLAVLSFARTVFLLTALAALLTLPYLGYVHWTGGGSTAEVASVLERLARWRASLETFSPWLSGLVFVALILILAWIHRRNAKWRVEELFRLKFDAELRRLKSEMAAGKWKPLPDTAEMKSLQLAFEETFQALRSLAARAGEERAKTPPDQGGIAAIEQKVKELDERLKLLKQAHFELDVRRRMRMTLDPNQIAPPPPRSWVERVKTLFVSQGILQSLTTSTRLVYGAGLVLVFFSLLGIQTPVLARATDHRIVELRDLRVRLSEAEAKQEWDEALRHPMAAPGAAPSEGHVDDDALSDELAVHFENAFIASRLWTAQPVRNQVSLLTHRARYAVLREFATATRGGASAVHELGALDATDRQVFEAVAVEKGKPATAVGKRFRNELGALRQSNPDAWRAIKARVGGSLASFQRPASANEAGRRVLQHAFGLVLDGAELPQSEVGQVARRLQEGLGREAVERAFDTSSRRYLANLARGGSLEDATRWVVEGDPVRPMWTDARSEVLKQVVKDIDEQEVLTRKLRETPPAMQARSTRGAPSALSELDRLRARTGHPASQAADAVAEYEDFFPGQVGSETRTRRAEILATWERGAIPPGDRGPGGGLSPGGGGGGGGPTAGPSGGRGPGGPRPASLGSGDAGSTPASGSHGLRPASRVSFARARSFSLLRGFSRIGGVLIGREPEPGGTADFRDFSWEPSGDQVRFRLVGQDGHEVRLGPFRKAVVGPALAYAADGRAVTVTMVTADPLPDLKILLHPALVDTPLGCRAIEIDRFVDKYVVTRTFPDGPLTARGLATQRVTAHRFLYELAWSIRLLAAAESELSLRAYFDKEAPGFLRKLELRRRMLEDQLLESGLIRHISSVRDPKLSLLAAKAEFFDAMLVAQVDRCQTSSGAQLGSCLEAEAQGEVATLTDEKVSRIVAMPPRFEIWSGVREAPFKVDPEFEFLKAPPANGKSGGLWPFEFMLQVAFTSPPEFGKQAANDEEFTDQNPWEFPELRERIPETVAAGIDTDPRDQEILRTLQEFGVLQRFFRVAFDGHLGPQFPVGKFVGLTRDTAGSTRQEATLRWQPHRLEADPLEARDLLALREKLGVNADWRRLRAGATCGPL